MIKASVSVQCAGESLQDVQDFAALVERLGVDGAVELQGGNVLGATVAELHTTVGVVGDVVVGGVVFTGAGDVWVELSVIRASLIECGSHVGSMPTNILLEVHPACRTCDTC